MLNKFLKDPNYLLRYFMINLALFIALSAGLFYFDVDFLHFSFSLKSLLLLPIAAVLGLVSATAFHNCSHGNIKPRILNTLIGELTANFSLEDLRCFTVGHMLHHKHTDDPILDPHPPRGMTFLQFIQESRENTINVISNLYYKKHGDNRVSRVKIKQKIIIFNLLALSKLVFWFLLFGLNGFLLFYIPSYLAYFLGFAHLNYISHLPDENGEDQISDRYQGAFYRIMNVLTSGGYYHKSHHLYPSYYNPSKAALKKREKSSLLNIALYD